MNTLYLDIETHSPLDLKQCGLFKYAYCDNTVITLISYAINDKEPSVWDLRHDPVMPDDLIYALHYDKKFTYVLHNAQFDLTVMQYFGKRYGSRPQLWRVNPKKVIDTMAIAYAHCLPGSLDNLCTILKIPKDLCKSKEGASLIKKFSQQPIDDKAHGFDYEWKKFKEYAMQDVRALRAVYKALPTFNFDRKEYYFIDRMNNKGITVDTNYIRYVEAREMKAVKSDKIPSEKDVTLDKFQSSTRNLIEFPYLYKELKEFLNKEYDLSLPNGSIDTFEEFLRMNSAFNPDCVKTMELYLQYFDAPVSQLNTLHNKITHDHFRGDRIKYNYTYSANKGIPIHRMLRTDRFFTHDTKDLESYVKAIKAKNYEQFKDQVPTLNKALPTMLIKAPKKNRLASFTLKNNFIHSAAYLLQDKKLLKDLYSKNPNRNITEKIAKVNPKKVEVSKSTADLIASGIKYLITGQGVGNLANGLRQEGHDIPTVIEKCKEAFDFNTERAIELYTEYGKDVYPLLEESDWVNLECFNIAFSDVYPTYNSFLPEFQELIIKAIKKSGKVYSIKNINIRAVSVKNLNFLLFELPSGRVLPYFNPDVKDGQLSYEGSNYNSDSIKPYGKWERINTHAGKIFRDLVNLQAYDFLYKLSNEVECKGSPVKRKDTSSLISRPIAFIDNDTIMVELKKRSADKTLKHLKKKIKKLKNKLPVVCIG